MTLISWPSQRGHTVAIKAHVTTGALEARSGAAREVVLLASAALEEAKAEAIMEAAVATEEVVAGAAAEAAVAGRHGCDSTWLWYCVVSMRGQRGYARLQSFWLTVMEMAILL